MLGRVDRRSDRHGVADSPRPRAWACLPARRRSTRRSGRGGRRDARAGGVRVRRLRDSPGRHDARRGVAADAVRDARGRHADGACGDRVIGTYLHGASRMPTSAPRCSASDAAVAASKAEALPAAGARGSSSTAAISTTGLRSDVDRDATHALGTPARASRSFGLRRAGRFLVADLHGPHRVLSTSVRHGGQVEHVRLPAEPPELRGHGASSTGIAS